MGEPESPTFSIFQQYKVLVENLFSCTIQQLQYDNGGEYLSTKFQSFLAKHGIFHHLTCPTYTSLQNGIAERKHRHIQEMGLTLLAQVCLPNCY
jgi:histone deacetylase 1/2